jgi:hypothetical protein
VESECFKHVRGEAADFFEGPERASEVPIPAVSFIYPADRFSSIYIYMMKHDLVLSREARLGAW